MSFKIGDQVKIIKGTSAVPSGSKGTVTDVAGNNVQVDFGVLLGVLITPAQNLQPAGQMVASESPAAALAHAAGAAGPARKIHWAQPAIGLPAGVDPADLSVALAPSNGVSGLFNKASIDLQGPGPLAGVWGTTLTFPVSGDMQKSAPLNVHVRGFVQNSGKASAVLLVYLDGKLHRKEFKRGKVHSGNFTWELTQTLPAKATTQVVTIVVLAKRASVAENITATIDSIDISLT